MLGDEHFDLGALQTARDATLAALSDDPRKFAATIYDNKYQGFFSRSRYTSSPYINTNDQRICCLIGKAPEDTFCPTVSRYTKVRPLGRRMGEDDMLKLTAKDNNGTKLASFALKVRKLGDIGASFAEERKEETKEVGVCAMPSVSGVLGFDAFTNEYIVGYILDRIYRDSGTGLDGYVRIYAATLCNKGTEQTGAILMELADFTLTEFIRGPALDSEREMRSFQDYWAQLPPDIPPERFVPQVRWSGSILRASAIIGILRQIIPNLYFLQESLYFGHGDLHVGNVLVARKPVTVNYLGINHSAEHTIKIASYSRASLIFSTDKERIRVHQKNGMVDKYFSLVTTRPNIEKDDVGDYYRANDFFSAQSLMRVRHSSSGFYKSWDTATFLISFLSLPEVWYSVLTDRSLQGIFWDIWDTRDKIAIFERISGNLREPRASDYEHVVGVLRGVKIRCTLTADVLRRLL